MVCGHLYACQWQEEGSLTDHPNITFKTQQGGPNISSSSPRKTIRAILVFLYKSWGEVFGEVLSQKGMFSGNRKETSVPTMCPWQPSCRKQWTLFQRQLSGDCNREICDINRDVQKSCAHTSEELEHSDPVVDGFADILVVRRIVETLLVLLRIAEAFCGLMEEEGSKVMHSNIGCRRTAPQPVMRLTGRCSSLSSYM